MNPYPVKDGAVGTRTDRVDRTKVNFEMNEPQVVTLEFNPPEEPRDGTWGPQYMYFCAERRIMFVDPPVHAQVIALGARAGSVVAIVKRKDGRKVRWDVNLVEGGKVVKVGERARAAAEEFDGRDVVRQEDGAPLTYVDPAVKALAEFDEQWREMDGLARTPPKVGGPERPVAEPPEQNLARALAAAAGPDLERALKSAIAAAKAAESYGAKIGYAVRFSAEDVRAMGISAFVAQGGRL